MGMVRSGEAWEERWGRIGLVTGGYRGALCCCAVLLCVLCVCCVWKLLCGVVVWCCCAVLLCSVIVQVGALGAGGMRARGAMLPREGREGDAAAAREEGRRGKLDKTTPCGRDILLHRGLAKCVAHLHYFE